MRFILKFMLGFVFLFCFLVGWGFLSFLGGGCRGCLWMFGCFNTICWKGSPSYVELLLFLCRTIFTQKQSYHLLGGKKINSIHLKYGICVEMLQSFLLILGCFTTCTIPYSFSVALEMIYSWYAHIVLKRLTLY